MALASAGADATRIYDELLVTTAEAIQPRIVENSINAHPVASIFLGQIGQALNSQIGETGAMGAGAREMTGESVRVNVKLGKNGSVRRLPSGYSELSLDTSDTARGSRANWKLYGGSVVISGHEMRMNSGGAVVHSLLNHKQSDTTSASVDQVAEDLLTSSSQPNSITSIDTIVGANDTVQSLSGGTFTNWNSRGLTAKGTAPGSIDFDASTGGGGASFASAGISNWRTAYMNAEEGSIRPNVILTTDAVYRFYEGSLTPGVRFDDLRSGDIGFQVLRFKGAPIFHDPYCPSGVTYFLNTDHLFVAHLPGAMFDISPMERGQNQDAFSAFVLFSGQLVTDARKYQNKITGQTA